MSEVAHALPLQWPDAPGRRVAEAFQEFTSWTPAKKGMAIGFAQLLGHLLYLAVFVLVMPNRSSIDSQLLMQGLLLWIILIITTIAIATAFFLRGSTSPLPLYLFYYPYMIVTVVFNYGLGIMDSIYAAYILLVAFLLALVEGWRAGMVILVVWAAITGPLVMAQSQGWIPYAPLYVERSFVARNELGLGLSAYAWALICIAAQAVFLWVLDTSREYAQHALERSQTVIRSYLPPAVADRIIHGKAAEVLLMQRRRVTVLFADIAGFTSMADRVDPEVVTDVVNEYLSAMADLIEKHGGTLNEFAGDGLMALFGAPELLEPEDQALRATRAASEMQARMPLLNERWRKVGIGEPLGLRIGINTGVLSVGSFGSNSRMTYTAIGLQTNIASRIQTQCSPGGVLISDATWQLVRDRVECSPKGEFEVKGVHYPVKVYEVPV